MGMEVLKSVTIGSGGQANTISITSIPATHDHLMIISSLRTNTSRTNYGYTWANWRFNDDDDDVYGYEWGYASSNTWAGYRATALDSLVYAGIACNANTSSGAFSYSKHYIPNYTSTDRAKVVILEWFDNANDTGSGQGDLDSYPPYDWIQDGAGAWTPSTNAAINRIDMTLLDGLSSTVTIQEQSSVVIYGFTEE